jgi:AraC-like DNA-binding protein
MKTEDAPLPPQLIAHRRRLNVLGALETGPAAVGQSICLPGNASVRMGEGNWHSHHRGQFLSAEDGMLQIRCPHGTWLVPPRLAVWLPPGVPHAAATRGVTKCWNIYLLPSAAARLPAEGCVVTVGGLTHELVHRVLSWPHELQLDEAQERVVQVLVDEIRRSPREGLYLPLPTDRRLVRIASANLDDLASRRTHEEWARWGGLSERSMSRLFRKNLGMGYAQWRQQARLMHAMARLTSGESVGNVSDALGYSSPSNFISMFRKQFGMSPARYMADLAG